MEENAMTEARRRLCVALLVLLAFSLGCSEFAVIGIEGELADAFGVDLSRVGELISFFSVAYAVSTPVLAIACGRFRRFPLLMVYAAVFCLGNLIMALAPTFTVMLVARVMLGMVAGALLALGVTYIPELVPAGRVSMTISVVYAAFSVAMVLVTSLGKMAAHLLDWHLVIAAVLVLSLAVSAALIAALPRSGATDEPARARDQLPLLAEPQVLTGIAIFVFGVGSVYVLYGYITPYLQQVVGLDALSASGVLMVYGGVCFLSNLISGWADGRFGMRTLLVSFPIQAAVLLAVWWAGGSTVAAIAAVLAVGLSMYVVSVPCISAFLRTARRRHPKALTLASSLEPTAFNIGIAFGTAVGGAVVAGPGIAWAGLVGGVFSLVAWALSAATIVIDRRRARAADAAA